MLAFTLTGSLAAISIGVVMVLFLLLLWTICKVASGDDDFEDVP